MPINYDLLKPSDFKVLGLAQLAQNQQMNGLDAMKASAGLQTERARMAQEQEKQMRDDRYRKKVLLAQQEQAKRLMQQQGEEARQKAQQETMAARQARQEQIAKMNFNRQKQQSYLNQQGFSNNIDQEKLNLDKMKFAAGLAPKPIALTPEARNLELMGIKRGTPEFNKRLAQMTSKGGITTTFNKKTGVTETTIGGQGQQGGLSPSVRSELQGDIVDNKMLIANLNLVDKYFEPQYLTFAGRGKDWWDRNAEKIVGGDGNYDPKIVKMQKFRGGVMQAFNAYRSQITGAAAAVAELDRLQTSFLNGSMSPSAFVAAKELLQEKAQLAIEVKSQLLDDGINPKSNEGEKILEERLSVIKIPTGNEKDEKREGGASQRKASQILSGRIEL